MLTDGYWPRWRRAAGLHTQPCKLLPQQQRAPWPPERLSLPTDKQSCSKDTQSRCSITSTCKLIGGTFSNIDNHTLLRKYKKTRFYFLCYVVEERTADICPFYIFFSCAATQHVIMFFFCLYIQNRSKPT